MAAGKYTDGSLQEFYEDGSPQKFYEDVFIGMTKILQQRGLTEEAKLNMTCKNFKCAPEATVCCQRRVLYNQPDFAEQASALEILCQGQGFEVIFLLKFHCELNFIEQCWGNSKRVYRWYPPTSKEDDLEKILLSALESVPLEIMHWYCHGPCLVTFFTKNNQRTAPTESPMMATSPLFSATFTTGHVRGHSALSDVSSDISPSPLYIPPHRR